MRDSALRQQREDIISGAAETAVCEQAWLLMKRSLQPALETPLAPEKEAELKVAAFESLARVFQWRRQVTLAHNPEQEEKLTRLDYGRVVAAERHSLSNKAMSELKIPVGSRVSFEVLIGQYMKGVEQLMDNAGLAKISAPGVTL